MPCWLSSIQGKFYSTSVLLINERGDRQRMMTPEEAGGKVWRIMDTGLEIWWKRKNWLYRIEAEVGETHEVQCHFCQVEGPFIDCNPKGGKKRSGRGKTPPPLFSYDFDWIKDNCIRGVSCLWKKKSRMTGWDWGERWVWIKRRRWTWGTWGVWRDRTTYRV